MKNFSSKFHPYSHHHTQESQNQETRKQKETIEEEEEEERARCEWDFSLSTIVSSSNDNNTASISDALGVIEFDQTNSIIATGGIARKIRIYSLESLLPHESTSQDVHDTIFLDHARARDYYICTPAKLSSFRWKPRSDGRVLGSGDYDGVVMEYNLERRIPIFERDEHGGRRVWSVDYSHCDPTMGASGSDDGTMQMWDTRSESGECVATVQPSVRRSAVCCVEFNPFGGPIVAIGCADSKVYGYDLRMMASPVFVLDGHRKTVTYIKFLDNVTLVSASIDGCLKLWNSDNSNVIRTYHGHVNNRNFVGLSVWRNGGLLGCGSENNKVFVYDKRWSEPVWVHESSPMIKDGCGIAFWVAMIVNSSFGFNKGNPLRLTYGLDYKGNVCGDRHAHPGLRELELTYWLNPNQVYLSGLKNSQFKLANARTICLLDCPIPSEDALNWVCDYPEGEIRLSVDDWIDRNYDYFEFLTPEMRNTSLQLQGPCYPVIFPSVNVYWRCQYVARASNVSMRHWQQMGGVNINEDIIIDKSIHRSINARSSVLKRYVADIEKSWPVLIVCGGLLPLFVSVIWLLLIRHFVAAMPWITVALFNILIIAVTMFYYLKAGWIGNDAISPIIGAHDPYYHVFGRELNHLRAAAVLMTFIMVVSILTSIAIVHRILMATSVLKVAAKVIGEVQALIIFPVMPYAILGIFYMFWFAAAFYLFSSGQIVQNNCNSNCCAYDLVSKRVNCDRCCGYSIHYTPHISIAIFFHLFGCYWATQFFIACSSTVIAGSVASYYWARGETSPEIPFLPVFSSMKQLIRYSLGSVALGSLVLSFVESVRFILESIRRKLKVANTTPESCMGKTAYHTSRFCFQCIEWIIRSVNRNAYIMIAITGKSFCRASAIATELIISNILRIGRVNVIGDVILYLGKLCVSLSSALFAFLMLDTHKYRSAHNKISSPLLPVLVCWALGYVVATLFFAVVEMSIDAIILSFCQDSEEHQGTAQYAPPLLMETLGDQNEMQRLTQ